MGHDHWDNVCNVDGCIRDRETGKVFCAKHAKHAEPPGPGDTKPTNPKDAIGAEKVPVISVMPQRVLAEVALGMLDGACKYGRHNYREVGVRASVYVDAAGRHLAAYWEGQDIDPDSGLHHVTKAISSLVVLRDSMLQGNHVDDRPPQVSDVNWVASVNAGAKALLARYPSPKEPFTQIKGVLARVARSVADKLEPTCKSCGSIPTNGCPECKPLEFRR